MKIRKEFKIRDIAGEKVVIMQGRYGADMTRIITLNATSEWLWNELQGCDFDAEKVADMLCGRYEVERETALHDAQEWIARMQECRLLE